LFILLETAYSDGNCCTLCAVVYLDLVTLSETGYNDGADLTTCFSVYLDFVTFDFTFGSS